MAPFRPQEFRNALDQAVREFDKAEAARLVGELVEHVGKRPDEYPFDEAKVVLNLLRRKRHFDLMQRAADAFIRGGLDRFRIRREYAQSLLDQGNLTAGIHVLRKLADDTESDAADDPKLAKEKRSENAEAWGLIGRAYKQLYTDSGAPALPRNQAYLREAVDAYNRVYRSDPDEFTWHGINAVALMQRAEVDGVDLGTVGGFECGKPLADAIATSILARVQSLEQEQEAQVWDYATAVEASVGLGRHDEAVEWLAAYLGEKKTDAFECASTYRQLTEVWQLQASEPPGDRIVSALRSALLTKLGGELEIDVAEAGQDQLQGLEHDEGYERVLGADTFQTVKWFGKCLTRARAVAQIEDSNGNAAGSGFLVRGEALHESLEGDFLLTNNHVVSTLEGERNALRPDKASVKFELADDKSYDVGDGRIVWESGRTELDATLIQLGASTEGIGCVPLAEGLPVKDGKQRAYVIGHPSGRKLSFSIHDNHILDYDEQLLHYRSPTEPGSSGSPVFNDEWDLIALHHWGSKQARRLNGQDGHYPANEGIQIQAIAKAMQKSPPKLAS